MATDAEWELVKDKSDDDMEWNVVHGRRGILGLRRRSAYSFFIGTPNDRRIWWRELWSAMMKVYVGCV